MAIISTDILLKTMIEAAIVDLRRNTWLLDDIFGGLATDPLSRIEYGYKEVDMAKKWFLSTDIKVFMQFRNDDPIFPCVTIVHAQMAEALDRTSLADQGLHEEMDISKIRSEPLAVVTSFTPKSYDPVTGSLTFPDNVITAGVTAGQYLIARSTSRAYEIKEIIAGGIVIKAGVNDDFRDAYILPPSSLWNVHRELTFTNESFHIGLHTQSNTSQNLWLHQLLWYILLRYKEAYLESRGFELSTLQSGPMELNSNFSEADQVFSRFIQFSGVMQGDWIKYIAPKLHNITERVFIADGPASPPSELSEDNAYFMEEDHPLLGEEDYNDDPLLDGIHIIGEDDS